MKTVTKYITDDGTEFDNESAAREHELRTTTSAFESYLKTYAGQHLLTKHTLDEEGVWEVRGEDPNCDLGGHHHTPYIGTVHGKLENAIRWGVARTSFWSWGGGGSFHKKDIQKV